MEGSQSPFHNHSRYIQIWTPTVRVTTVFLNLAYNPGRLSKVQEIGVMLLDLGMVGGIVDVLWKFSRLNFFLRVWVCHVIFRFFSHFFWLHLVCSILYITFLCGTTSLFFRFQIQTALIMKLRDRPAAQKQPLPSWARNANERQDISEGFVMDDEPPPPQAGARSRVWRRQRPPRRAVANAAPARRAWNHGGLSLDLSLSSSSPPVGFPCLLAAGSGDSETSAPFASLAKCDGPSKAMTPPATHPPPDPAAAPVRWRQRAFGLSTAR